MPYRKARYHDEDGFTLVAVLGFILLLAMVLTPFALSARISALTSAHAYDAHRLSTAAKTANDYLAWRVASDISLHRKFSAQRQTSYLCAFANLRFHITIQPHSSLINLNTADLAALNKGFIATGLSISDSETLAAQILQYRTRASGEEQDHRLQFGMKHSPFEDIAELHEWPLLQKLPLLTLFRTFSVGSGTSSGQWEPSDTLNDHFTLQTGISYHNRSVTEVGFFEISSTERKSAKVGQLTARIHLIPTGASANCPGELLAPILQQLQVALP